MPVVSVVVPMAATVVVAEAAAAGITLVRNCRVFCFFWNCWFNSARSAL
jgi:hypothetical protein